MPVKRNPADVLLRRGVRGERAPIGLSFGVQTPWITLLRGHFESNLVFTLLSQQLGPHHAEIGFSLAVLYRHRSAQLELPVNGAQPRAAGCDVERVRPI